MEYVIICFSVNCIAKSLIYCAVMFGPLFVLFVIFSFVHWVYLFVDLRHLITHFYLSFLNVQNAYLGIIFRS
jgi:hypothetical protein